MKKLILLVSTIIIVLITSGCGVKKEATKEEFSNVLSKYNFLVNDYTDISEDKTIEKLLVAKKNEYAVEFHIYKTEDDAKRAYTGNKKEFKKYKEKNSVESSKDSNGYQKYSLELSDRYDVVIRNGKTFLYASINLQYTTELNKIINDLGY